MIKSLIKYGSLVTLCLCTANSMAIDCGRLIQLGNQKSVIPVAKGVQPSDIQACLQTCGSFSGQSAQTCYASLSTLAFAVNYNDALSGLSPQNYSNAPAMQLPSPEQAVGTTGAEQPMIKQDTTTPGSSYITVPKSSSKKKSDNGIHWY